MKKKRKKLGIWLLFMSLMLVGIYAIIVTKDSTIKASTVVKTGDFDLEVYNRWDSSLQKSKSYAELIWDKSKTFSSNGYQLYQSSDSKTWNVISTHYGKEIKVLNVYPQTANMSLVGQHGNRLKIWMDKLNDNLSKKNMNDKIVVDEVTITELNASPDKYLKQDDKYKYDVIMFGTYDGNAGQDLSESSVTAVQTFIDSGRGVLFGHDTVIRKNPNFSKFGEILGVTSMIADANEYPWQGSTKIKVATEGHLLSYPFPMALNMELAINFSHTYERSFEDVGTVWINYAPPFGLNNDPNFDLKEKTNTGRDNYLIKNRSAAHGWYLKTNANVAMIQTGHSYNIEEKEIEIIANVLMSLAQVTADNEADDRTVADKVAPEKPTMVMNCEGITVDATDQGTEYQWKVVAKDKTSDIVKETITSNIAGYFYVIDNNETTKLTVGDKSEDLKNRVEAKKNEYGLISKDVYSDTEQEFKGIFVDPETDETEYNKKGIIADIDRYADAGKYLHVVAVDRSGNVSEVTDTKIGEIPSDFSYEIERNKDTLKLVNLDFKKVDKKMKSMEITVPKNIKIENYGDVEKFVLPDKWETFDNTIPNPSAGQDEITGDYRRYTFSMQENNSENTITSFLKNLTFVISGDKDKQGSIKIIMGEKVVASTIGKDGKRHFYIFEPFTGTDFKKSITWMQAYNQAKTHEFRGLTGYLATVTSPEEHDFIYEKIATNSGWLGGTRMVMADNKSKINDEDSISENIADYYFTQGVTAANYVYKNESGEDWYWTDGPEAGQVFFDGPIYQEDADTKGWGKTAKDMYSGFNNPDDMKAHTNGREPNSYSVDNKGVGEYVLEFARDGNGKYWNDFDYERTKTGKYATGYYVEFSEYGDQKEEALDETESSWCSRIPQKVKLEAYDVYDENNPTRLPEKDIIYDQNLRIGSKFDTADDLTIPYYKYIEMRETDDTERVTTEYIISDIYQTGKIIYSNRTGIIHVRQVVKSPRDELVLPNNGYSTLKNVKDDATFTVLSQMNLTTPSTVKNEEDNFTTYNLTFDEEVSSYYKYTALIPMYYKLEGYAISLTKDDNLIVDIDKSENWIPISFKLKREYWVTVYITPDIELDAYPNLYHWNYKTNDLGKIISSKE